MSSTISQPTGLADTAKPPSANNAKGRARQRNRLLLSAARLISDGILIYLAFFIAWWLRYEAVVGPEVPEYNYVDLDSYIPVQLGLVLLLLAIFSLNKAYSHRLGVSFLDELGTISAGTTVGIALMIIAVFYYRPYALSRLMFVYALFSIIILLALSRFVQRVVQAQLRKRGIGLDRVLVVGAGSLGRLILRNFVAQPGLGVSVVGFVDDERTEDIGRFKALGKPSDISRLVDEHDVDQLIIALPSARHRDITKILENCRKQGVSFRLVPDFYEFSLRQVDITELCGIPLIGLKDAAMGRWAVATKRTVDLGISFIALVLLSPLLGIIALAIKLDSPGPIIFHQERLGRGGKPFTTFKFRSMRVGAEAELEALKELNEADGPIFKIREDPRITRVGRWLRRTSLDELPQIFNILNGDMSLVGPRPPIPAEVEQYEDWHRKRLDCAPGLTGLWQVSGRSNVTFDEMVLLDLWYVENWSLALDIKILAQTLPAVMSARGAY